MEKKVHKYRFITIGLSVLELKLISFIVSEIKKLFLTEFFLSDVISVPFSSFMTILVHILAGVQKAHRYSKN